MNVDEKHMGQWDKIDKIDFEPKKLVWKVNLSCLFAMLIVEK